MKRLIRFLLIACVLTPVFGQNYYVTDLEVVPQENTLTLSWKDDPDLPNGSYILYRSASVFTPESYLQASPVRRLRTGAESIEITPPTDGAYYYAIVAQDDSGNKYPVFIDYANTTVFPVAPSGAGIVLSTSRIEGMQAMRVNNRIIVQFTSSIAESRILVYRSTDPIGTLDDLNVRRPLTVLQGTTLRYEDEPLPGVEYYYAALDALHTESGEFSFRAGIDTTAEAVKVPLNTARTEIQEVTPPRALSLPMLVLDSTIDSGAALVSPQPSLPDRTVLSEETTESIASLIDYLSPEEPSDPITTLLQEESNTADSTLSTITTQYLLEGDWPGAETALLAYLNTLPDEQKVARSHFYLGQAYYFQQKYRNAFMELLLSEEHYPEESKPWQSAVLGKLADLFETE